MQINPFYTEERLAEEVRRFERVRKSGKVNMFSYMLRFTKEQRKYITDNYERLIKEYIK